MSANHILPQGLGQNDQNLQHCQNHPSIISTTHYQRQQLCLHNIPLPEQQRDGTIHVIVSPQRTLQILQPGEAICDGDELSVGVVRSDDRADEEELVDDSFVDGHFWYGEAFLRGFR